MSRRLAIPPGCAFHSCERKHYSNGYCSAHDRQRKRGSTLHPIGPPRGRAATSGRPRRDRWVKANGYAAVAVNDGRAWVYEHRQVMEAMLERELLPGESVHHRNGDRADNRPENLELWVRAQPYGQRVEDMLKWAHELIDRYERT